MKKMMWISCALFLAFGAVGCGKNKSGGNSQAQTCVPGWVNGTYNNCQNQQYPGPGQPLPGGYPIPGNGGQVQCGNGQFRLGAGCVYGPDFATACRRANGSFRQMQGQNVCMVTREVRGYTVSSAHCTYDQGGYGSGWNMPRPTYAGGTRVHGDTFKATLLMLGTGCVSYSINANVGAHETVQVSGSVTPRKEQNDWNLSLKKGYSILDSAQSGTILNAQGENFSMMVPPGASMAHTGVSGAANGVPGSTNSFVPAGGYGGAYGSYGNSFAEPIILEATVRGTNTIRVRLSAASCTDPSGNFYTCY